MIINNNMYNHLNKVSGAGSTIPQSINRKKMLKVALMRF